MRRHRAQSSLARGIIEGSGDCGSHLRASRRDSGGLIAKQTSSVTVRLPRGTRRCRPGLAVDPLKDPIGVLRGFATLVNGTAPAGAELVLAGPTSRPYPTTWREHLLASVAAAVPSGGRASARSSVRRQ